MKQTALSAGFWEAKSKAKVYDTGVMPWFCISTLQKSNDEHCLTSLLYTLHVYLLSGKQLAQSHIELAL